MLASVVGVASNAPLESSELADWDQIIDVNLRAVLHGIAAMPVFRVQSRGTSSPSRPPRLVKQGRVEKRSGCAGSASTRMGQLLVREEGALRPPGLCHLNCNVLLCRSMDRFAKLRLQGQQRRADQNIRCSCRP